MNAIKVKLFRSEVRVGEDSAYVTLIEVPQVADMQANTPWWQWAHQEQDQHLHEVLTVSHAHHPQAPIILPPVSTPSDVQLSASSAQEDQKSCSTREVA